MNIISQIEDHRAARFRISNSSSNGSKKVSPSSLMPPPVSFFLPSRISIGHDTLSDSHPLLITSDTAAELLTFAITYTQHKSEDGRYILITSQDKATFTSSLSSSILTSSSS